MEEINRGAEAILYKDKETVVKARPAKDYRIAEIDSKLRLFRTRKEANVMRTLIESGVHVPNILSVDDKKSTIIMDFVSGPKLRDVFDSNPDVLATKFGEIVGKLHSLDIVHGDLTTSNMIVSNNELVLIDFGLSAVSKRIEDKAVDLRVLERSLESRHHEHFDAFSKVLKGYKKTNSNADKVLKQFEKVQLRGRNKKPSPKNNS